MLKAFWPGGRSSDVRSSSSSKSSVRRRTESKASSTVSRKSSRGDDRDRGLGDLSTYSSSGSRNRRYAPSAAGDSIASSYATAEPGSSIEFERNVIERAPRRKDTEHSERHSRYPDGDDNDDMPLVRRNRARSPSRERTRKHDANTVEVENGDRARSRRERQRTQSGDMYISPDVPTSGAGANFAPEMGLSNPFNPPAPFHNTHPVTSILSSPNVPAVYDPHVQQQFPGQFPALAAEPYRPPNPAGEAADYYGDQGQSVSQQPGVRPKPPAVIPNTQAHLMTASPSANPPPEPSSLGQVGAAAVYFEGDTDVESQVLAQPNKPPSRPVSKPPKPTMQTEEVLGPAAAATAHGGGSSPQWVSGSGSPPLPAESTPLTFPPGGTNTQKPPHVHGIGTTVGAAAVGATAGYMMSHHHQSSLSVENALHSSNQNYEEASANGMGYANPSMPPHQPNAVHYPAGTGEAAAYAAHPSHPHHAALYHAAPFQSGGLAFQQRQRGPLDRFLDFWRDSEGVGMFEDYTETIGVCKHCFEPGTSSRDAPRKHYYNSHRRPTDRYSNGSRVEKASRYSSSEDESRRYKKASRNSWLPGMLAKYTFESLFNNKDIEGTYSVRSGRVSSLSQDSESISAFERRSHTSRGVYRRSNHRSYEGSIAGDSRESRRRSRSRSRSSSRPKKHSVRPHMTLGVGIGTAPVTVSELRNRSRSRSQRRRKTKSRKSSSSDSSSLDISKPARKSVGGAWSTFFTATSENRRKRQAEKRRSIFSFNNSSSSSLDADLAFGSDSARKQSGKSKKRNKKKDRDDVHAALIGLGAVATKIAGSTVQRSRHTGEIHTRKESKSTRLDYTSSATNDDAWEDVDSSSVNSLAFGGSELFGSNDSQSSYVGPSLWSWGWGNKPPKKRKGRRRFSASEGPLHTNTAVTGVALGTAALVGPYGREGKILSEDTVSGTGSLQQLAPMPTSDLSHSDMANISSFPSQPALIRPGPIPLQQPQPVTPVSQAVYTSQGETIHTYTTAPSGPPPFGNILAHRETQPHSSRVGPKAQNISSYPELTNIPSKISHPARRRDSSPVFPTEPLEATLISSVKHRTTMKDQTSVQFDLTQEQAEKERRTYQLERLKRDPERQEGLQLIDRESEIALRDDERRSRRFHQDHRNSDYSDWEQSGRDCGGEKHPTSWVAAVTTGEIGAATTATVLSSQASFSGFSESTSSQRRYYERSEKRRAERRRMSSSESISSNLPMPGRGYDDIDQRPTPTHQEERIKKPVYTNYAQFFAPEELRYSPDTHARREPASMPTTIEPEATSSKATEEPHSGYHFLSGPVPELRLIEPTPPQSQIGFVRDSVSPTQSSPEVCGIDKVSTRPITGSRVSWGKLETHEYEIPSTSSEFESADQDFVTGPEQEKYNNSKSARDMPAIPTNLSKSTTSDYDIDIEFAATVTAATAAAGFGPSVVSVIREKLVSPSGAPHGYVESDAITPDVVKQPVPEKFIERGPLYSEPEPVSESDRPLHRGPLPSSSTQEVIPQRTGKQPLGVGELTRRVVEEANEDQQGFRFHDRNASSVSPPDKGFHMPGGFEPEESFGQQKPPKRTQEPTQGDSKTIVSAPIPGDCDNPTEVENNRKNSGELDTTERATSPAAEGGSTEEKKKRRKRPSKRDSDGFHDSISAISSPARIEETTDRRRSTEEKDKERKTSGLLSNIFGSKVSEQVASKMPPSSDSRPSGKAQSEVGSEESRRQRREGRRQQTHGELMELGKLTEREKDRVTSQDKDDELSFLAGSPEMPMQVGNADYEGASGRLPSTNTERKGLGLGIFENRSRSRSASPPASERAIDLSPKSQSRPTSPELARIEERNQDQQSRRSSSVRLMESPTAIPLHFRRPPSTSPRAHRSLSASSPAAPSPASPTGQRPRRPASGEFINSREMRPLWLVERHGNKVEAHPDEPLPSLPSSKTSSVNASAEDLPFLQDKTRWEKLDFSHSVHGDHLLFDADKPPATYYGDNPEHGTLDSEEETPTAASFNQTNTHQLIRKEKPKYEFHSPSELLHDPSTYVELPQSPTMGALPSAEGSAVGVKYVDSLPPLPVYRPSTPETKQRHASNAVESPPTQEQTAPDVEAPQASGDHGRSGAVDTSVAKVAGVDLLTLEEYGKGSAGGPSECMEGNIELGEGVMSHEAASPKLVDKVVAVLPDVQLPTTEPVEKVTEDACVQEDAAFVFANAVNVPITAAMGSTDEKHACLDEPLPAGATDEATRKIGSTLDGQTQLQDAQPEILPKPPKPLTNLDFIAPENKESLGNARVNQEYDPSFDAVKHASLEKAKGKVPVHGPAVTESAEPITGNAGKADEEAIQTSVEEFTVDVTAPSSSKKKKKARKKKGKNLELNDYEQPPLQDPVAAVPSASADVGKMDELTTPGGFLAEQNTLTKNIQTSAAEEEPLLDISKTDEEASKQAPVDMLVFGQEPVANVTGTEDKFVTEPKAIPEVSKNKNEVNVQKFEGESVFEPGSAVQAENLQTVVDSKPSLGPFKQEPVLRPPELNRAPLTADTLITGRISTSGLSITEVAPEAQMPEITTVPVQGSVMSIPNPDNTPITHAPTTEQVMPMHMPVTEKTHEGDLVSEKMLDSDALPASTSGETFADTDVFTKGLKRNKKRRKQGKGSDTGENNDGPSGMAVVESSQSAPEAVTTQATEEPSQLTIKDFQSIEESSLPTEENLTSNSEDPVQATTKGVESLQKPDESSQQDVLLLEKHAEHPVELALEEPSKEYPPPELQDSTEEYIPAEVEAPEVAHGPDQLNIAVPGQNAGAASLNGQGGGSAPAADPQERVAIVVSSSADFTPRTPPLEDKRHVSKEAEASAEPGSEQLPPEQQQTQDIPMLVEPTDTPELAGIVTESGAPRHDTGPASTPTEILLSRKSNKNDEKGENRENVEEPAVEKISDDVPRTGPADEGAIPQVEAEPTVPPNAEPETKQPEEVQDGKSGVTSHLPSETTPDVAADTSVEFQDTGSTESTQGANSEEALGVQSKTKGQKSKKNRKSISSSDSQAEANAENQPRLSSTEGLTTAETPLAKTSGVGELAATNETTRIEKEDPIPTVEYESNVPVPDIEPGEATLPGKKNKKKKKKKKQSVPPSAPDADPIAAESAEPSSRTEVANTKTDVPIAAEDPSTMKGQELDLEGTIGNEQSVALAEAAADAISPPMAPSITTAQRKKAKKDKKQRKPATPDELPTLEPAVVLNRAEDSLEQDSVPVGEPAPVQEPDEANDALIQEPTNINEVADEQPRNEELTDTDFVIVPKGGFDEKTEEPTQQEHNEISGDGSEVAAIDAAKVDLDQGQHTDHTPSRWEATLTNKEQPEVDDQSAEEQSTVKIAGIEQLATSENLFEADPVDDTLNTAPATNSEAAREQSQEEALSEKAAPERDGGDETSATNFFSQDAVDGGHEFSTPKKSKKDKKKKKKQQSLPLEEGQPAVVEEGSIEEPSGTLSDLAEVPEQQQRPVLDDDPQMPQNILPKEPVQELEAKEDGPAGPAEQAEAPRPAELGPTAESQTATAKKKAKKDKKKRKSMSFTTNEEEAPAQLPENIEVAESSEQFGEDSKTPEQPNIQMTEKSALAQPSREDAGSNISNEAQLTEAPANLPKDVLNTASELSGPTPTEAVAHGEQVTLPSTDSVIEAQTDTSGTVALYPMSQALPAAEELVDKTVVSQPEANTFDDARGSERPEDKEEEPDTGDLAPPNSGEVLPTPANSTPETSFSPPMQESTTVVEDAEQKTTPSKSKKDKKKKKRKTQESNDNEHSAAPEPDVEETPVQIEEVDNPATPEVSESNNVLKGPKTSSEDVPSFSLEPSADDTRTGAAQAVYSTGHDAKESERTEQQATEQSETPQDDGTPNMSAKEKRKAKKKEKKRQSKSLDGSNAALTGAESASLALEEKAQDPLENAEATFVEDVVRDATETQISSEMKPSDPSVYTGIPPVVEDDGRSTTSDFPRFSFPNLS
ncbi:hypothetical protein BDV28DRAFT_115253 [Aspergillus coremiiformis]|uniref:Involucrin repeat protein n=1 Tax=Aspergillus coremiiformis TaxID=138285 RepID=A0A5N6ZAH7_9EURO|nr:hypothetical protein BDV28DRAFT_115253 [Aspergillus coremiiformis]